MRHLIKRILREETQKDLSPLIKKLLDDSVVPNHKLICKVEVKAPWNLVGNNSTSDYQVVVTVIGGAGSKNWPMTQFVHGSRDKVVHDVWHTVYNFMGIDTDVFLKTVKSCDEVMTESTIPNTFKRRANIKILQDYITDGEINYPELCDDFEDGYEYADSVIDYAIDKFVNDFDETSFDYNEDYYSEVMDYLRTLCRNEFGQELISVYNTTCIKNTKEEQNEQEDPVQGKCEITKDCEKQSAESQKDMNKWMKELKSINAKEAKMNADDLKKTFDMNYDRDNFPLDKQGRNEAKTAFEQIKGNPIMGGGKYKVEQKFAVLYKVLSFLQNVPKISYTLKLAKRFNISNPKSVTLEELAKYASQMGWDNFIEWYLNGGPEITAAPMNEEEITERCWKGYTQKGMKTMFGKRYPNCVKKK